MKNKRLEKVLSFIEPNDSLADVGCDHGYLALEAIKKGVKKVLNAAAWTYVAALITSILSLLRLLLFIFSMRRD